MSKELIPIDTEYKGYFFRSRLEARWAVFFEKMGWRWEYEVEGYELPSGRYLPDFYFPDLNCYAEVKHRRLNEQEYKLCKELTEIITENDTNACVILLEGQIELKSYRSLHCRDGELDVIFIPKGRKYYPLYFSGGGFDKDYFEETAKWLMYAKQSRFEFEWKEQ